MKKSINFSFLLNLLKRNLKKHYHSEKLLKLQGDAKQTGEIMKKIGKAKVLHSSHFPQKITVKKIKLYE